MAQILFVCHRDGTMHNGVRYRAGDLFDGNGPRPRQGLEWSPRRIEDDREPEPDSIVTSSSRGRVGWVPQPARPAAEPLTREQQRVLRDDPYARIENVDPRPAAPTAPQREESPEPSITAHQQITQAERDDPFGRKAAAIAAREELLAERELEETAPEPEPEPEPELPAAAILPTSSRMSAEERANMYD